MPVRSPSSSGLTSASGFGGKRARPLECKVDPPPSGLYVARPRDRKSRVSPHRSPRHRCEVRSTRSTQTRAIVIGHADEEVVAEQTGEHVPVDERRRVTEHRARSHRGIVRHELRECSRAVAARLGHRSACRRAHDAPTASLGACATGWVTRPLQHLMINHNSQLTMAASCAPPQQTGCAQACALLCNQSTELSTLSTARRVPNASRRARKQTQPDS